MLGTFCLYLDREYIPTYPDIHKKQALAQVYSFFLPLFGLGPLIKCICPMTNISLRIFPPFLLLCLKVAFLPSDFGLSRYAYPTLLQTLSQRRISGDFFLKIQLFSLKLYFHDAKLHPVKPSTFAINSLKKWMKNGNWAKQGFSNIRYQCINTACSYHTRISTFTLKSHLCVQIVQSSLYEK